METLLRCSVLVCCGAGVLVCCGACVLMYCAVWCKVEEEPGEEETGQHQCNVATHCPHKTISRCNNTERNEFIACVR